MRLIGIGLLAFLLAGLALLLARSEMVGQTFRAARTLVDGPQLRFETPMAAEAQRGADQAIILRASPAGPLILSGLPAYQGAVFHMPIDARPTSGYLQIDATSQVLDGVEGVLRISIDNTRRAEVLLHPGEAVRAVRIELTPAEITRAQLVVSFSLQGTGANLVCTSDHSVEAVVEIETTSAVYLSLDAPLESPRDRVAAWGDQVRLTWDGAADTLAHAVAARQAGSNVLIVPEAGLSVAEARSGLGHTAPSVERPEYAWSEALDAEGGLYGLRRFRHSYTWRLRYDFAEAQRPNRPDVLELAMVVPPHPHGADWQVTVTQNGRLLRHISGTASQSEIREDIALPADPGMDHVIEITLTSAFLREGECNDGPELLAEILPQARVRPSEAELQNPAHGLSAAFAHGGTIGLLHDRGLTAAEANVAAELLRRFLPDGQGVSVATGAAAITVLPRGTAMPDMDATNRWLAFVDADGALRAEPAAAWIGRDIDSVALLVDLLEVQP